MSELNVSEFLAGFILEATENLHSVNRNLVATSDALNRRVPEPRAIRDLFRSIHTIKGLAAMVGADPIVDVAHEMETILRTADRAGGRINGPALDLLLQGTRFLEERVHWVSKNGLSGIVPASKQLLEALGMAAENREVAAPTPIFDFSLSPEIAKSLSNADREQLIQASANMGRAFLIEFQPSAERAAEGFTITSVRERLGKLGDLVKVMPKSAPQAPTGIAFSLLLTSAATVTQLAEAIGDTEDKIQIVNVVEVAPVVSLPNDEADTELEWVSDENTSIRVDVRRLDNALERLADLVVTRSKISNVEIEMRSKGVDTRELRAVIAENSRQLKNLRAAISEARMVPLAELFQRLPLVVRGLTKDTSKRVDLTIHAGSAEVDKAVADKLFPAVLHLIRNAVDHAIENLEDRRQAGKPEAARLTVHCDDSSGINLVLTISDDGRGIDRQAVAERAQLPVAENDDVLLQQISKPGLSTSKQLTHTSGRGMGMDIVKRTIEMLGGNLTLKSESGKGTTFTITAPLSITIVDVFCFVSDGQNFAVPVAMVEEIIDLQDLQIVEAPSNKGLGPHPRLLQRRGQPIVLLGLGSILNAVSQGANSTRALVVKNQRESIAFGVDRLLGQQEVVIRPLEDALVKRPGIAGATDLGDGRPTLILDLATLGTETMRKVEATT